VADNPKGSFDDVDLLGFLELIRTLLERPNELFIKDTFPVWHSAAQRHRCVFRSQSVGYPAESSLVHHRT
jgi:hypothetical protein